MDSIQGLLDSVLFAEKFTPANTALTDAASHVHTAFWQDAYNRNLRLQDVEIEVRLGKCPARGRGAFDTSIPEKQFRTMLESLQGFNEWDDVAYTEDVVGYFPKVDESVRHTVSSDGSVKTVSKQKVSQADYVSRDLPFDLRVAVNLELDLAPRESDAYTLATAGRIVTRKRQSFTWKHVRYDLTRVVDHTGAATHQVELELVDLPSIQLRQDNAQVTARELQARIVELMNALEPIRSFDIELLRKRHF